MYLKGISLQGSYKVCKSYSVKRNHLILCCLKENLKVEKSFFFKKDNSVGYENLTSACFSISRKTDFAGTSVRSNSIFTLGINVTSISAGRTFVDI